mmetsp:Transcript_11818/g.33369  ORF Transcript_11818/g.33369 Transcript_11818/m.33369 type:complete len:205 (-) Transcript_11818:5613-6227(-)
MPLSRAEVVQAAGLPWGGDAVLELMGQSVHADGTGSGREGAALWEKYIGVGSQAAVAIVWRDEVGGLVGVGVPQPGAEGEGLELLLGGSLQHALGALEGVEGIRARVRLLELLHRKGHVVGGLLRARLHGHEAPHGSLLKALVEGKHTAWLAIGVGPVVTGGSVVHLDVKGGPLLGQQAGRDLQVHGSVRRSTGVGGKGFHVKQ